MDEQVYPPEASRSGKNSYYHHCGIYNGRPNYGVCLFIIEASEEKRLHSHEDCAKAIRNTDCPALKMRQEERDAGKALYYVPRPELTAEQKAAMEERKTKDYLGELPRPSMVGNASYVRGWNSTGKDRSLDLPDPDGSTQRKIYIPPPAKSKPKLPEDFTQMDAGALVTEMAEQDKKGKSALTLLDIARGNG